MHKHSRSGILVLLILSIDPSSTLSHKFILKIHIIIFDLISIDETNNSPIYKEKKKIETGTRECRHSVVPVSVNKKLQYLSASTILVFVTFSIVNFVFPPLPAILPMALDK